MQLKDLEEINKQIISMHRNGCSIGFIVKEINRPERYLEYDYVVKILEEDRENSEKQRECEAKYYLQNDINVASEEVFCSWLKYKHYEKMINRIEDALNSDVEHTKVPINKFCDISDRMFEARKEYIDSWKQAKDRIEDKYGKKGIDSLRNRLYGLTDIYKKPAELDNHA